MFVTIEQMIKLLLNRDLNTPGVVPDSWEDIICDSDDSVAKNSCESSSAWKLRFRLRVNRDSLAAETSKRVDGATSNRSENNFDRMETQISRFDGCSGSSEVQEDKKSQAGGKCPIDQPLHQRKSFEAELLPETTQKQSEVLEEALQNETLVTPAEPNTKQEEIHSLVENVAPIGRVAKKPSKVWKLTLKTALKQRSWADIVRSDLVTHDAKQSSHIPCKYPARLDTAVIERGETKSPIKPSYPAIVRAKPKHRAACQQAGNGWTKVVPRKRTRTPQEKVAPNFVHDNMFHALQDLSEDKHYDKFGDADARNCKPAKVWVELPLKKSNSKKALPNYVHDNMFDKLEKFQEENAINEDILLTRKLVVKSSAFKDTVDTLIPATWH
jgi:hypothetical protein